MNEVQRLIGVIDLLNQIEIKGFFNIKNLGAAIQQLDRLANEIDQRERSVEQLRKTREEKAES